MTCRMEWGCNFKEGPWTQTSLYLEWWVKTPTVSIFFGTSLYLEWWVKTPTISFFFWNITLPWMMGHFFWNITVPWMMGQNSNRKHFFLEHHSTLNDGTVSHKKKKKKEERMIGQNSNHKHYLISRWVIWDSGANWTQKWTVVINVINLLTSIFKTLVENLVKKKIYEKRKKNN